MIPSPDMSGPDQKETLTEAPVTGSLWVRLRRRLREAPSVLAAADSINRRRLHLMALVAIPIHLAHVLLFLFAVAPTTPNETHWRHGIIAAHSVLLVLMSLFAYCSRANAGREQLDTLARWLPYIAVFVVLIAGAAIVAIDQLVTSNITPFLIVCTILAVVFLLPPLRAVPLYALGFAMYYVALGITQHNPDILMSNRVNGITAIGIATALSIILWNAHRRDIFQRQRIEQQQRELEEKNRELQYQALYDPLTGLFNRRSFEELAQRELAAMRRHGHATSLIISDIDLFKQVNDAHGHPAGDELLRTFSTLLRTRLRSSDIVCRWGGEEFVLLLPHTSLAEAVQLAEKLRAEIETRRFEADGMPVRFTASFGVAELAADGGGFTAGYRDADAALYTAKRGGRNRVEAAQGNKVN